METLEFHINQDTTPYEKDIIAIWYGKKIITFFVLELIKEKTY